MAADPTEEPATEVPIPPDLAPATAPRGSVPASLAPQDNVLGGILLILGLLLPIVATLLIADMIGAIVFVHWDAGFWNMDGG